MANISQNKVTNITVFDTPDSIVSKSYVDDLFGVVNRPVEGIASGMTAGSFYYADVGYATQTNEVDVSNVEFFPYDVSTFQDLDKSQDHLAFYDTLIQNSSSEMSASGRFVAVYVSNTAVGFRIFEYNKTTKTFNLFQTIPFTPPTSDPNFDFSISDNYFVVKNKIYTLIDGEFLQTQVISTVTGNRVKVSNNYLVIAELNTNFLFRINLSTGLFEKIGDFRLSGSTSFLNLGISDDERFAYTMDGSEVRIIKTSDPSVVSKTTSAGLNSNSILLGITPDGVLTFTNGVKLVYFKESDIVGTNIKFNTVNLANFQTNNTEQNANLFSMDSKGNLLSATVAPSAPSSLIYSFRYNLNGNWDLFASKKIRNLQKISFYIKNVFTGKRSHSASSNLFFVSSITTGTEVLLYPDGVNYYVDVPQKQSSKKTILVAKNII